IVVADAAMGTVWNGSATRIVTEHLIQRGDAAVVLVRRGHGDVPDRRRLEFPDVFRPMGRFIHAGVGAWIRQQSGQPRTADKRITIAARFFTVDAYFRRRTTSML